MMTFFFKVFGDDNFNLGGPLDCLGIGAFMSIFLAGDDLGIGVLKLRFLGGDDLGIGPSN